MPYVYILTESETGKFLGVYDSQKNAIDSVQMTYAAAGHTFEYRMQPRVNPNVLFVYVSDIRCYTIVKHQVQDFSEHL